MGLQGQRAREAYRRGQERTAGRARARPLLREAARPERNPWALDVSELDGEDAVIGPGSFRFDVSELDGQDGLAGRSIKWFVLDVTCFGRGVLL